MAVDVLPGEGDEQAARLGRPAVEERRSGDPQVRRRRRRPRRRRCAAISPSVSAITSRLPSASSAARSSSRSSKGCTTPAISWPVSWPLPAITTVSPGRASATARRIAVAPVADLEDLGVLDASSAPASTAARMVGRVLGAGVVVGDHQHVGEPGADLAHHRPLAGVAVAAGADHEQQPARGERPQRGERGLDRVRLVRVVDDREELLARVDALEPARDAPAARDPVGDQPRVEPGLAGQGDRAQRVGDVEVPGQRHPGGDALAGRASPP